MGGAPYRTISQKISPAPTQWEGKNFLFHDTVKGARASAIIYSLVETAKLNNLNIYAYLETVLLYMPDYKNEPEGIEELMPWSEMIQQRCQIKSKS